LGRSEQWRRHLPRFDYSSDRRIFSTSGRSVAQFSDTTFVRLLAVSGVNEEVLRAVIVHDHPVPFLLEDTLRRFELDQ
jgi:hypothetical protein